jgi:phenylalanyl-tRNA synthetase alpha chain
MHEEFVKKLHVHEKKILIALKTLGEADVKAIAEQTGLPEASINKASLWLKIKGLVNYKEASSQEAELTKEGRQYASSKLPERKLIEKVQVGENDIKSLTRDPGMNIAIAWAKKKGWIEFSSGKLKLTATGKAALTSETDIEKSLKEKKFAPNVLEELRARKFVDVHERVHKKITLTEKGKEVLPYVKIKDEIEQLTTDMIRSGAWKDKEFRPYDVESPSPKVYPAKIHPYMQFLSKTRKKLVSLGFSEMKGPLIELEFWNFDALYQPQNHPARDWASTYQLKFPKKGKFLNNQIVENVKNAHEKGIEGSRGWNYKWDPEKALKLVPRAHGTCLSARTLASKPEIPGKYFAIARCFRPDVLDATHLIEFNQVEGIVIDESLTFRSLLGVLKKFAMEMAGAKEVRFYPDYYPFTEPSVQMSAKHPELGWIEFGGAGIFREEVTKPLGVDAPVIAWGLGVDRLAMFKLGISDIRYLFTQDLDWLRKSKMVI